MYCNISEMKYCRIKRIKKLYCFKHIWFLLSFKVREISRLSHVASFAFASFSALANQQNAFASDASRRRKCWRLPALSYVTKRSTSYTLWVLLKNALNALSLFSTKGIQIFELKTQYLRNVKTPTNEKQF